MIKSHQQHSLLRIPEGPYFLRRDNQTLKCPYAQPDLIEQKQSTLSSILPPQPPRLIPVKPDCGSWCPLFHLHTDTQMKRENEGLSVELGCAGTIYRDLSISEPEQPAENSDSVTIKIQ